MLPIVIVHWVRGDVQYVVVAAVERAGSIIDFSRAEAAEVAGRTEREKERCRVCLSFRGQRNQSWTALDCEQE